MSDPGSGGADGERERSVAGSPPEKSERDGAPAGVPPSAILSRLVETRNGKPRYRLKGEIARGGMGAIWQVWDDSLDRSLAMKVILESGKPSPRGTESSADEKALLARFLEEAQVTGQLDHPGIVPVHELGVDAEGRVFFTMKLVKGRDLKAIFDLVFAGAENERWNETRALGVLLKVCEAMAYAHAKGAIHRDLKPANVMVGDFGEVYVMDWGLARVLGRKDAHDLRLRPDGSPLSSLKTERRKEREGGPDAPIITMDGDVVGTPSYMPPEQARGDVEALGPRSDVYSIGAMLYHLLSRQMPYFPPGARVSTRTLLAAVLEGPPKPLSSIRREVPAELVAIAEKAMARESAHRYASTLELAEDLRAYLEHRVVKAYETGPVAELRKWVVRNKPLAATIAAAVVALFAALVVINDARIRAKDATAAAERERDQVLRLSDVRRLKDLESEAGALWPAHPENVGGIEDWLRRARELASNLDKHRERLSELRANALPRDAEQERLDRETHPDAPRLAGLRDEKAKAAEAGASPDGIRTVLAEADAEIARLEKDLAVRRTWKFTGDTIAWQHGVMAGLVEGIESLTRDDRNWSAVTIAALERRLEFAETLQRAPVDDEKAAWDAAIARIRASDEYGGLELAPQVGLVPLGEDPASGLWEFWHIQSGERPVRGKEGRIVPHEAMGIVLVLIPGGTFTVGSPESESGRYANEGPQHDVTLGTYFISKYEMTQGQWTRFAGRNPSDYKPPGEFASKAFTLLSPVEQVSWDDCSTLLRQLGLELPTETQWECAARGGTRTPWWTGAERESLRGKVNIADQAAARGGATWPEIDDWRDLDDGHPLHALVGSTEANPYGLHEVTGNVLEWCRDWYGSYELPVSPLDGERQVPASAREDHVSRGGGFIATASDSRIANRLTTTPETRNGALGVRPARRVTAR